MSCMTSSCITCCVTASPQTRSTGWHSYAFDGSYEPIVIRKWLYTFYRRFFSQQFKRSCLPDGPKVGSVAISPRGDWRMPSDASGRIWLEQIRAIDEIEKSFEQ